MHHNASNARNAIRVGIKGPKSIQALVPHLHFRFCLIDGYYDNIIHLVHTRGKSSSHYTVHFFSPCCPHACGSSRSWFFLHFILTSVLFSFLLPLYIISRAFEVVVVFVLYSWCTRRIIREVLCHLEEERSRDFQGQIVCFFSTLFLKLKVEGDAVLPGDRMILSLGTLKPTSRKTFHDMKIFPTL
jgi:hypothetical protein